MTTTTISKKKTRRPRRILFILLPILLILVLGFSILFFLSHQNLIFQFRNNLAATFHKRSLPQTVSVSTYTIQLDDRSQIKRARNEQKDTRPSATLSYARVSVQKACFVLDAIRGKDVATALGIVTYNPRYASSLIKKLLESAVANAENNNGMKAGNLYVEECYANQAPTMKRIKPRAQGRAYRILKRTSHITVVLNEK